MISGSVAPGFVVGRSRSTSSTREGKEVFRGFRKTSDVRFEVVDQQSDGFC